MSSVSLEDPFKILPFEINVKIGSHLPQRQILMFRSVCKLWEAVLSDNAIWSELTNNFNWIIKYKTQINDNIFKALCKNKQIAKNIETLNFVSRDFFPIKSNSEDFRNFKGYTVWNNSLVVGAVCNEVKQYLVVNDDQSCERINYSPEIRIVDVNKTYKLTHTDTDEITCMTVHKSQLLAGSEFGKIYQLCTDLTPNGNQILFADLSKIESPVNHSSKAISYIESFQENLIVLTTSKCLSIIDSYGQVIKTCTEKVDKVKAFGDEILFFSENQLGTLNDQLEILRINTFDLDRFLSLDLLNNTIIAGGKRFSFNDLYYGTYENHQKSTESLKLKLVKTSHPNGFTVLTKLIPYHNHIIVIDTIEKNPAKTATVFVNYSDCLTQIHCYDLKDGEEKSSRVLFDYSADYTPCTIVKQDKVFLFYGSKIIELDFNASNPN